MDMTAVRALALTVANATHGVDATVTVLSGSPVVTRGIWLQHPDEVMPVGRDFQRRDPRRLLQLPLTTELPDIPRGSTIVAAPRGTTVARTWRVENVDSTDADQVRVIVAPVN
jgi:hypothetical protein